MGIPAYHQRPSAPTNLTLHQAIDINVPIGCGDAPASGDIILGDQDGIIVIPANLLDEIADETFEMTATRIRHRAGPRRGHLRPLPADQRAVAG